MSALHPISRRLAALTFAVVASMPGLPAAEGPVPEIAGGPFKGDMESLKGYRCPEWFRDAKFGIWAHWGPQAVPMMGDWYAKHMYVQGHPQYEYHVKNYGHPTKFGYKDIIALWKAEKFDPDRLMALYQRAGARYFVSMACHHDNFDLWNSTHHRWNAVKMGPERDIVGDWQAAAKKLGLKFGVSEHMGASFTWFQTSRGSDKTGPLAGVPYDGASPEFQDLYHPAAAPGDGGWYSNNPDWHQEWFRRIKDLVDNYRPDLLYTDGGVPFGAVGQSLVAHLYNASASRSGGRPQVVYTSKQKSDGRWIEDLERGVMAKVNPDPWQTDTSIGDWYYNRNWKFRPVSWAIHMLVDIVSKNGNLLLNVVQRPDGSIDPEAEAILEGMAPWIAVNGEAIYGTRPWTIYGEGPVRAKGGHFGEDFAYTAGDIRFTTKGGALYAFALGWPEDGKIAIRALAEVPGTAANRISRVELLGARGKLEWKQSVDGLTVGLPAEKPCDHAIALKILGSDLTAVVPPIPPIRPADDGSLKLEAEAAELHGSLKVESKGNLANIGFWDNAADEASWEKVAFAAGTYEVSAFAGTVHPGARFAVEVAGQAVVGTAPNSGSWEKFETVSLGKVEIKAAGELAVKARAADAASWKAINLVRIVLRPVR